MNKQRRKAIEDVTGKIRDLLTDLECLRDEEEEYKDNMPENLQGSEKYEKAEECVYGLGEAIDDIDRALDNINEYIE